MLLPPNVPVVLKPKTQASLLVIEPPTSILVRAPPAARLKEAVAGCVALVVNRHERPAGARRNEAPIMFVLRPVMFGRIPVKLAYRTCHGSDACRIVAPPPVQLLEFTVPLLMKPIRAPTVLAMTFE